MTLYRLWPSTSGPGSDAGDSGGYTMGVQFQLSADATLTAIYWWRAEQHAVPDTCGVFDADTQALIAPAEAFTDPGSATGWIRQQLVTPLALDTLHIYRAVVHSLGGSGWYSSTAHYWDGAGPGASGLVSGVITAPNDATAVLGAGGQDSFHPGGSLIGYPDQANLAANYWIDIEVDDGAGGPVALAGVATAAGSAKASLATARPIAGKAAAAGVAKGSLAAARALAGKASAADAARAALGAVRALAGKASAASSGRGALTVTSPAAPWAGKAAAAAYAKAALSTARALAGKATAASSARGTLTVGAPVTHVTASGSIQPLTAVNATIAQQVTASGDTRSRYSATT